MQVRWLATALQNLDQEADYIAKDDPQAASLVHLAEQNRLLKAVSKAAELYMRSGHGEHEHSVLIKTLADVQRFGSG